MPNYKLTYFDAKARGEIARLIFAAAGVGNMLQIIISN